MKNTSTATPALGGSPELDAYDLNAREIARVTERRDQGIAQRDASAERIAELRLRGEPIDEESVIYESQCREVAADDLALKRLRNQTGPAEVARHVAVAEKLHAEQTAAYELTLKTKDRVESAKVELIAADAAHNTALTLERGFNRRYGDQLALVRRLKEKHGLS